ncbi:hypothetical protein ACWEQ2_36890, partial [Streptomyces sp. NPDC004096]
KTFAKYGETFAAAGLTPNDGLGGIFKGIELSSLRDDGSESLRDPEQRNSLREFPKGAATRQGPANCWFLQPN